MIIDRSGMRGRQFLHYTRNEIICPEWNKTSFFYPFHRRCHRSASRKPERSLTAPSAGRPEIRIVLVFDPWRSVTLLVAGDKSGRWDRCYRTAILRAKQLYPDWPIWRGNIAARSVFT